jgi:7,8-dihydropterin-6-yl-methyl-4-(beta-D-ribofuranosyl)aminobenzene 5'-phosphate synthase
MKLTVLLENYSVNKKFKSNHGLSLFIEYKGKIILLDTGSNSNFLENAKLIKLDLSKVDYLFLSHNHSDHTGGINDFLGINNISENYLMDGIFSKYYNKILFF